MRKLEMWAIRLENAWLQWTSRGNRRLDAPRSGAYGFLETEYGRIRYFSQGHVDTPTGVDTGRQAKLVFIMDGPACLELWEANFARTAKIPHGVELVAYEPPGVGLSVPYADYDYSIARQSRILNEVVVNVVGSSPYALCAGCSNVLVAIDSTRRFSSRKPEALALWQCGSIPEELKWLDRLVRRTPFKVPVIGQILNLLIKPKLTRTWFSAAVYDKRKAREFSTLVEGVQRRGGKFTFASLVQGMTPSIPRDSSNFESELPTLFFWGKNDRSHRKTNHESSKQLMGRHPAAKMVSFDQCGHFPEFEQTEAFVDTLVNFLRNNAVISK